MHNFIGMHSVTIATRRTHVCCITCRRHAPTLQRHDASSLCPAPFPHHPYTLSPDPHSLPNDPNSVCVRVQCVLPSRVISSYPYVCLG